MHLGRLRYLYFPCNVQSNNCSHLWFLILWAMSGILLGYFSPSFETWSPKSWISAVPLLLQGSAEGLIADPCPTLSAGPALLNPWFESVSQMAITGLGGEHFENIHGSDFKPVEMNLNFHDGWKFILLLWLNWLSSRAVLTNGKDREK